MEPQWMSNANAQKEARSMWRICVFILICFRCHCGFFLRSFFGQNWNASGLLRETEIALSAWEAALYSNPTHFQLALVFNFHRIFIVSPTKQSLCTKMHRWHFLCFLQVVIVKLPVSTPTREVPELEMRRARARARAVWPSREAASKAKT